MATKARDMHECIGGKWFDHDGNHVPLNDRPDELVGPIARPFLDLDGIHDVTFAANVVSVYATGWDEEDVLEILTEETEGRYRHVNTVDNTRKKNIPKEADEVLQFQMV